MTECAKGCWLCRDGYGVDMTQKLLAVYAEAQADQSLSAQLHAIADWMVPRIEYHLFTLREMKNDERS